MADVIIFIVLAAVLWTLGKPLFVKQPTIQKKWTRRRVKFVNFLFYLGCILGLFMNSFFSLFNYPDSSPGYELFLNKWPINYKIYMYGAWPFFWLFLSRFTLFARNHYLIHFFIAFFIIISALYVYLDVFIVNYNANSSGFMLLIIPSILTVLVFGVWVLIFSYSLIKKSATKLA